MRPRLLALTGAVLLAACAQPEPAVSDVPLPELAATAEPVAAPSASPAPSAGGTGAAVAPPTPAAGSEVPAATRPADEPEDPATEGGGPGSTPDDAEDGGDAAASRELAVAADRRGDAGLEGPDWADLVGLRLVDTGPDLAVTVILAGAPPANLREEEVVGIGVDLFSPGAAESTSQLFVDGGSDGWRAYLQTSDGFVAYPGQFRIEGPRLELSVPWPSVEGPSEGEVRAFLDWSRRAVVTNLVARDDVPDRGRLAFSR